MNDNLLHRRDRVIITTIDIIDELGIQGLSTREIAKRQGISEGTLFRHFKSKNEILMEVLNYFCQYDDDIFQTIQLKKSNPKEAIKNFVSLYTEYYENYPAITSILHLFDVLRYDPELNNQVMNIQKKRRAYLKQLVEEAKNSNNIFPNADSDRIADIIYGIMREICLNWRLENRIFSLKVRTLFTVELLFRYITP